MESNFGYFSYLNRNLTDAYCTNNGLHYGLYQQGLRGFFINYLNTTDIFRSINISEILCEKSTLNDHLITYSASELKRIGLQLPINFKSNHINELTSSYLLNSALCWVSVKTKKGTTSFFATKSIDVLKALAPRFAKTEERKKIESFQVQLATSYSELTSGIFNVVAFTNNIDGLKLSKVKVNINDTNTFITTMYSLGNYIDSVAKFLHKNTVAITYTQDGVEKELVTTLAPSTLALWIGKKDKRAIKNIISASQNPFVYGELTLPNLNKKDEFINLHVLTIRSITKLD